jgi:hypothetical protein
MNPFPSLNNFGPTRQTLQRYARAISAIARVHAESQQNWWHISLRVTPSGLVSDNIPTPHGGILAFRMDFHSHQIVVWDSSGWQKSFPMSDGLSPTEMGDRLIQAAAEAGLYGEYQRERFESDTPGIYDVDVTRQFFTALASADRVLKKHRARLAGDTGPVQFWPHGFDLAMEWFGTRMESFSENGEAKEMPAQLNFGFYPGNDDDASYFYSNPWPFEEDRLLNKPLPAGASWRTEGWQGTIFPYAEVIGQANAEEKLLEYAETVFDLASPTLTAL